MGAAQSLNRDELAKASGPSLFEVEYLGLLFKELGDFMKSSQFPTIKEVVIGVRGENYQVVLPLKFTNSNRGERS